MGDDDEGGFGGQGGLLVDTVRAEEGDALLVVLRLPVHLLGQTGHPAGVTPDLGQVIDVLVQVVAGIHVEIDILTPGLGTDQPRLLKHHSPFLTPCSPYQNGVESLDSLLLGHHLRDTELDTLSHWVDSSKGKTILSVQ